MPIKHLLIIYLIGTLIVFLPSFGIAKFFKKAGLPAWKAYIPFYNTWVMQSLAQRPKHWVFWQLIPVVGWFISPGIFIEFVKLFGQFSLGSHTAASILAPVYFPYLSYKKNPNFIGAEAVKKHKKRSWREWVDAAIFAVVAATLIRTFVFEAYTIPSGSMEKSLLVNDFLFVSKMTYGPRIPNTPVSFPFVHNYLPIVKTISYSEIIKLPYIRWWANAPKRGDAVVFNFPQGDTVIHKEGYESLTPYYSVVRMEGNFDEEKGRNIVFNNRDAYPIIVHPTDKTDNYIKRCVGVAGDVLEIKDGDIYIDNKGQETPPMSQRLYFVRTKGQTLDADIMKKEYHIDALEYKGNNSYLINMPYVSYQKMKAASMIDSIAPNIVNSWSTNEKYSVESFVLKNNWALDNYGPIWIPKKGASINLNDSTYLIYQRAIRVYEKNDFSTQNGKFFLNGKEVSSYTFKMDYYWMMGDNRHGSQDSRYWGFVPEDRVVGKASLIWFSIDGAPRWKRIFMRVK